MKRESVPWSPPCLGITEDLTPTHDLFSGLAAIAQLVEHLPCKQGVRGSSPRSGTTHTLALTA